MFRLLRNVLEKGKCGPATRHGWRWGIYSSHFLNLGTRRGWVVSITPRLRFTPGEGNRDTHGRGGLEPRAVLETQARGKIPVGDWSQAVQSVVRHYTEQHCSLEKLVHVANSPLIRTSNAIFSVCTAHWCNSRERFRLIFRITTQ
jgi:hypothetical protein